jgi:hypothetical protein
MTIEALDRAIHATPFRPFSFMMADGRRLPVPHPDLVAFNPKGRMDVVMDEHDGADWVDLRLVASLDF